MGEDKKKSDEKKEENPIPEKEKEEILNPEGKKEENPKAEEKKEEKPKAVEKKEKKKTDAPTAQPPPQEIVLKVYMHCEGCARKVRRCLKGFEGVEDITTDCKTHKVVVKGEKADPLKVLERVQKKSNRQAELISPIPKPSPPQSDKKAEEKEVAKPEEKKEEPQVVIVVLSVQMHCEACAEEIKRRILRMKGVENVEPELKNSQVTVKGVFDPPKLVEYIHKRTGKHVSIVKQEPEKKKEEPKPKTEDKKEKKPAEKVTENPKPLPEEKKGGGDVAVMAPPPAAVPVIEAKKSELYYTDPVNFQIYPQPQRFDNAYAFYPPAPQMFSDENPNACTVM